MSRERVAANRAGVIAAAAHLNRERGVHEVGIDAVVADAGLTPVGFYKSFSSEEDLVCEAFRSALASTGSRPERRALRTALSSTPSSARSTGSLSPKVVPSPALPRTPRGWEAGPGTSFRIGAEDFLDAVETLLPDEPEAEHREKAVLVTATMAGALTLARAVGDEEASARFPRVATEQVLAIGDVAP